MIYDLTEGLNRDESKFRAAVLAAGRVFAVPYFFGQTLRLDCAAGADFLLEKQQSKRF